MKAIFTLVFILTSFSAMADVRRDVQKLGRLAMGYKQHKITGKDARQILAKYFEMTSGDPVITNKEFFEMINGDEVDHGFTSLESAKLMKDFALSALEEKISLAPDEELRKKIHSKWSALGRNWDSVIDSLHTKGVKFGYAGNGPGSCGMSYVELLIIDSADQKLYEVYLSEVSQC